MKRYFYFVLVIFARNTFETRETYYNDLFKEMQKPNGDENLHVREIRDISPQQNISFKTENEMEKKICDQKMRSCKDRCGVPKNTSSLSDSYCQCDDKCVHYQDCCVDFESECNIIYNNTKYGEQTSGQISKYGCIKISQTDMVYMDETCASDHSGTDLEEKCRNRDTLLSILPASDVEKGIQYSNVFCARCNNVKSPVLWETNYSCHRNVLDESDFQNPGPITLSKVMQSRWCSVEYISPLKNIDQQLRPCIPTIHTCPEGTDYALASRCANSNLDPYSTYKQQYHAYHNWYCLICTETDRPRSVCTLILRQISLRVPDMSLFSIKILVDVTSDNDITLRSQTGQGIGGLDVEVECNSDSVCKALSCPKAYVRAGNECKLVSNIVPVQIICYFFIEPNVDVFHVIETYIKQIFDPVGLIEIYHAFGNDKFTFNTSFPVSYTLSQIYKKMASNSERIKEKTTIPFIQLREINVTYDVSFMEHMSTTMNSHVTEKVTNCGSHTGSGMTSWMCFIFLLMKVCFQSPLKNCIIW
ncbi:unnamed protein product [Owenia fusiformis]|uniref:Uncharacterized protein n=1 Tax=Owenia fusiformis TaxID=6347 RepID=A0A8J1XJF3_OWEFU|nr:unnamed protein product [Owenia fusiformis]